MGAPPLPLQAPYLSDSLPFDGKLLHLGEVVIKCHNIGDDGLFIRVLREHVYITTKM